MGESVESAVVILASAKTLARLMHPHFIKEDQIALPLLGLLAALARGDWNAEMAEVLTLTEQLEAELSQMLAGHRTSSLP